MSHVARPPFPSAEEHRRLAAISDQIDTAASRLHSPPPPQQQMVPPPTHGAPKRDAVASLVDQLTVDVVETIRALQVQLKALEDQVLVSATAAKAALHQQVEICDAVRDQTEHMREIIDGIAQKVLRL